jgi:IclR family acetate operon transcriptional repressor
VPTIAPRNSSSSLRRALGLVRVVAAHHAEGGCTLGRLSADAGLAKSTVVRLMAPLLEFGYVEVEPVSGRHRLGAAVARLGSTYLDGLDVRAAAADVLRTLAAETAETVHLLVPQGVWMVYVDKAEAPRPVRMASRVGARQPMYSTASGVAYLAASDGDAFAAVVAAGLAPRTPNTPTAPAALRAAVGLARERGYAVDDIANEAHIRAVAAVVVDATGRPVAAISIVGPDYSLTPDRVEPLGRRAIAAADAVSARLGAPLRVPMARNGEDRNP